MYSCNAAKREHPLQPLFIREKCMVKLLFYLFRFLKMNKANHFLVFHAAYSDGRSS